MRWLLWGRQYGKTYQTIKWFLEDPESRVIIQANEEMAAFTRDRILRHHLPQDIDGEERQQLRELLKRQVVSVHAWQRGRGQHHGRSIKPTVAVDNLEHVLPALLGTEVGMVTATGVSEQPVGLRADEYLARLQEREDPGVRG